MYLDAILICTCKLYKATYIHTYRLPKLTFQTTSSSWMSDENFSFFFLFGYAIIVMIITAAVVLMEHRAMVYFTIQQGLQYELLHNVYTPFFLKLVHRKRIFVMLCLFFLTYSLQFSPFSGLMYFCTYEYEAILLSLLLCLFVFLSASFALLSHSVHLSLQENGRSFQWQSGKISEENIFKQGGKAPENEAINLQPHSLSPSKKKSCLNV